MSAPGVTVAPACIQARFTGHIQVLASSRDFRGAFDLSRTLSPDDTEKPFSFRLRVQIFPYIYAMGAVARPPPPPQFSTFKLGLPFRVVDSSISTHMTYRSSKSSRNHRYPWGNSQFFAWCPSLTTYLKLPQVPIMASIPRIFLKPSSRILTVRPRKMMTRLNSIRCFRGVSDYCSGRDSSSVILF
jgi:hypothetical protein